MGLVPTHLTQKYQNTGFLEHNNPFAPPHVKIMSWICPILPRYGFLFVKLFLRIKYFQNARPRFYEYIRKFYEKKKSYDVAYLDVSSYKPLNCRNQRSEPSQPYKKCPMLRHWAIKILRGFQYERIARFSLQNRWIFSS